MGKNSGNSWLNAVKRAFRSPTKDDEKTNSRRREEKEQGDDEKKRTKKRWLFRRHFPLETTIQHNFAKCSSSSAVSVCNGEENSVRKQPKMDNCASTEQRRALAVAMATAAAAEAAVATAQAAVEIVGFTTPVRLVKEHEAAVVIQTFFRGFLARRALLALKGIVKLQALIRGHNVRTRAKMTLQCIQSLVRVQALVCDQRRRKSCEAMSLGSMLSQESGGRKSSSGNVSKSSDNLDVNSRELEDIQALIQKAQECSLRQGKALAHALSQQMWASDEDGNLRNQRNPIKAVKVNKTRDQCLDSTFFSSPLNRKRLSLSVQSPKTPSSSKITSNLSSPCYQTMNRAAETPTSCSIYMRRMSLRENSCPFPRPNYMAATASAMARVRPHSTPRLRPSSPGREPIGGSAKKRLSFPIHDGHSVDDNASVRRYRGVRARQSGDEQRSDELYYATE